MEEIRAVIVRSLWSLNKRFAEVEDRAVFLDDRQHLQAGLLETTLIGQVHGAGPIESKVDTHGGLEAIAVKGLGFHKRIHRGGGR